MKKSIKQIPKYQFGNWIRKQPNVAQGWLQSRTFPVVNSRVLREWERTGKRPQQESSKERTERLKKEATQKTWRTKAADIAHNVGNVATTTGLIGSAVLAPVATLGALAGGVAGGKLADVVTRRLTRSEDNPEGKDFAQWFNNKFGLRDESMIGHIFNPGMLAGGAVGARMAPTVAGWYKPISSTPEAFVHPAEAASTGGYVSPSIRRIDITTQEPLMASDTDPGVSQLLYNIQKGKIPLSTLEKHLTKSQASKLQKLAKERFLSRDDHSLRSELLLKYLNKTKGKKGTNAAIKSVQDRLLTEEQKVKKEYDSYLKGNAAGNLEDIRLQTEAEYGAPVKWNWYDGGILAEENIPARMAITNINDNGPIMQQFFTNAEAAHKYYFDYLIKKKLLIPYKHQWIGIDEKGHSHLVDPSRYIMNYALQQIKGNTNRIPYILSQNQHLDLTGGVGDIMVTEIPWHGTNIGDKTFFDTYRFPTGTRSVFASVHDGMPGFANVKSAYGTAARIPLARKLPEYELGPLDAEGLSHNSNNYGGKGELKSQFDGLGKARLVREVSDVRDIPGNTGQRQNEYNYGEGTPDVKSLFNTGEFIPNAGFNRKNGGILNKRVILRNKI